MAYTFLVAVNAVLKRIKIVQGDTDPLTSFSVSGIQTEIDNAKQVWNEVLHELYSYGVLTGEVAEGSITLTENEREYSLESDFEEFSGKSYQTRVFVDQTNGRKLFEYPAESGEDPYNRMFVDQLVPDQHDGLPNYWALSRKASKVRVDSDPGSTDAGAVYKYLYDKRISLSVITDTFPVSDTVVDALTPVVAEMLTMDSRQRQKNPIAASAGFSRAVALSVGKKADRRYGPRYHQG